MRRAEGSTTAGTIERIRMMRKWELGKAGGGEEGTGEVEIIGCERRIEC